MPTETKFLGVYGAVWLAAALVAASALFARRMLHLVRILAMGRRENRIDHWKLRLTTFVKEVLCQSRLLAGEPIINWAHPLIFWGFCLFVIASALLFVGGVTAPWIRIPQAEGIPVLGTLVDLFAAVVLVGLVASSIRRYLLTPAGLQRTVDATIVVALIAALMVTYLLAEAGGHARQLAARETGQMEAGGGQSGPPDIVTRSVSEGPGIATRSISEGPDIVTRSVSEGPDIVTRSVSEGPDIVTRSVSEGQHAAEAGGGQTWLPVGNALAGALFAAGTSKATVAGLGVAAWWVHAGILLFFLVYLPYSKHMHLMWAPAAVFFAELPHKGTLPAAREKSDDAKESPLAQFTWRMLLNAYACAECGRCERVCPAAASGSKLSPRAIVHDLKGLVLGRNHVAGQGRPGNGDAKPFIGGVVEPEALWACTTCYACVDRCPVRNEQVALIVEMRRKLVEDGTVDPSLQDALVSLQRYGNSQVKSPRKRLEWAKGLPFSIKDARKEPVETLWFLGDYAAFHPSSVRATRSVALAFQAAGLDFGTLGEAEQSAGNDVRRAGEEGLFEMLAEKNMKAMGNVRFDRIVTTDPHTYHALKREYGRFGLDKPVLHYTEVLDDLLQKGKLPLKHRLTGCAVYHDPCYLGRYNGIYDPPRRIIDAVGLRRVEMPRNRENSFCCGAGGGRIWMKEEEGVAERPAAIRTREALDLPDVTDFVVACPKDLGMFEDAVKTVRAENRLRVIDLGELVYEAMGGTESERT